MIEKICARLEAEILSAKKTMKTIVDNGGHTGDYSFANGRKVAYKEAIEIVQEVAKEFATGINVGDKLDEVEEEK